MLCGLYPQTDNAAWIKSKNELDDKVKAVSSGVSWRLAAGTAGSRCSFFVAQMMGMVTGALPISQLRAI